MEDFNIKNILQHGDLEDDYLYISWGLTEFCNYQCSYCCAYAIHLDKQSLFIPLNETKEIIDKLFLLNKDKYIFTIAGGEPTLHPYFLDIIKYMNDSKKNIYLEVITNASRTTDLYSKLFDIVNNIDFYLKISIHLEYIKNFDHLIDILKLAKNKNKNIIIAFMLHPDFRDKWLELFKELIELKKNYIFDLYFEELYFNDELDERYTKEDFDKIKYMRDYCNKNFTYKDNLYEKKSKYKMINGHEMTIKNYNSIYENKKIFTNYYCCVGTKTVSISHIGEIGGAECPVAKKENIHNDNFNWIQFHKYIKCTAKYCRCRVNDAAPKFLKEEDAIKYQKEYFLSKINFFINDINHRNRKLNNQINELKVKVDLLESNDTKLKKLVDFIAWWIPIKKWRNNFRNKIYNENKK